MSEVKHSTLKVNLNRLIVIAALLLLLKLFTYLVQEFLPVFEMVMSRFVSAFLPFIIALIIAFLIEPAVLRFMKYFRIRRMYASILVITFFLALLLLALVMLGSRLYRELAELSVAFPAFYEKAVIFITDQINLLEKYVELNPEIQNTIKSSTQDIIGFLQNVAKKGSMILLSILGAVPGGLVVIMVASVATLLTSMSFPAVKEWFFGKFKGKYTIKTRLVAADLGSALVGFLRAETILVAVTAVVITVGLLMTGNKYAFTIGILAGLLDLIPVIGPSVIFIPWAVVLLITEGFVAALKIFSIYLAASVIRQVLEPKIMSQNIGLHPLPTLISMYVGLKLFGPGGLVIGPAVIVFYNTLSKARLFNKEGE